MIRKPVVLITGAGGEIGHGLIERLAADASRGVITLDVNPLDPGLASLVQREFTGSILDDALLERIMSEYEIDAVFHLAALLSTRAANPACCSPRTVDWPCCSCWGWCWGARRGAERGRFRWSRRCREFRTRPRV